MALRLIVAHCLVGSSLWNIRPEPQRATTTAIGETLENAPAQIAFETEGNAVRELLGLKPNDDVVAGPHGQWSRPSLIDVFAKLLPLDDDRITRILTFIMAQTLEADAPAVEVLGNLLEVDMRAHWQTNDTFFALLRDKSAINAMLAEVAGKEVADANCSATAKVQKSIIRDCLDGRRSMEAKDWQPHYLKFPMQAYTDRGGIPVLEVWASAQEAFTH